MQSTSTRLWEIGGVSGLAAGIAELLLIQTLVWLRSPARSDVVHGLVVSIGIPGTAGPTGLAAALSLAALLSGATLLGFGFVALVAEFHGLAATPGTLIIGGATFSAGLWWFGYGITWAYSPSLAHLSPTPQLVASLTFGVLVGGMVALAGVRETPCLE